MIQVHLNILNLYDSYGALLDTRSHPLLEVILERYKPFIVNDFDVIPYESYGMFVKNR